MQVLEVEPTRAVGHRMKKEHPLQHPEVFEWKVTNVQWFVCVAYCFLDCEWRQPVFAFVM